MFRGIVNYMESLIKKLIFLVIIVIYFTGCAEKINPTIDIEDRLCAETITSNDLRPDILVIGDSISIGYTPYLKEALTDYDVVHNPCNAMSSNNGIKHIDSWLAMRDSWYAITFNHGLWDIKDGIDTTEEKYRSNLTEIAIKIKARTTRPVFILSTRVPVNAPYRRNADIIRYNQIATEVMNSLNIPIVDLYSISETITDLHINPELQNDVHYVDEGHEILASSVVPYLHD